MRLLYVTRHFRLLIERPRAMRTLHCIFGATVSAGKMTLDVHFAGEPPRTLWTVVAEDAKMLGCDVRPQIVCFGERTAAVFTCIPAIHSRLKNRGVQ